MLPINLIREYPEIVKEGAKNKNERVNLDKILKLDNLQRELLTELNQKRSLRNSASQKIGIAKKSGKDTSSVIAEMRDLSTNIRELEKELSNINNEIEPLLLWIPNIPHESVPVGKNSESNITVREWGVKPNSKKGLKNHLQIGEHLGLFDFKRGASIAGSGFPLYIGKGAILERALINYMLDFHINNYNFTEVFPPFLSRSESMLNTAQIPKLQDDMYHITKDELFLIPTAEVPLTNIHQNEIIDENKLPINYSAYSACFRREAGSYGKDTKGFIRLHQFNKVELVKFVKPEDSYYELEVLTKQAEAVLQSLGIHYRVLSLCTGDLSFASAKSYDIEVWAPGEKQWLEVSTCSNFEAFQARRGKIKYRKTDDKKTDYVHTLNGSGVATPRLLIALLETYQKSDGSVLLPKPLHSYFGAEKIDL